MRIFLHGNAGLRTTPLRGFIIRNFDNYESTKNFFDYNKVYYNFIRKHTTLGKITPAEAAGIFLNLGRNRFLSLIEILLNSKSLCYCR